MVAQSRFWNSHSEILLALAKYKYLTVSQLASIGKMGNRDNASRRLKELKDRKLVRGISYGFTPWIGRVENANCLTPKGRRALLDGLGLEHTEIRMPVSGSNVYFKDYFHRRDTVDFHIALLKWAEKNHSQLLFFHTYFDREKKIWTRGTASTKFPLWAGHLIPDGAFMLWLPQLWKELFLLEVYRWKDTLRTFRQLKKHAEALVQGSANSKYNFEKPYRVLCVFEHNSMMQAVMGRMVESGYFSQLSAHFLFKLLGNITWHDLATGRWSMGKKQVGMLGDATNVFLVRNILIDF
jgi:hypothetical protein